MVRVYLCIEMKQACPETCCHEWGAITGDQQEALTMFMIHVARDHAGHDGGYQMSDREMLSESGDPESAG